MRHPAVRYLLELPARYAKMDDKERPKRAAARETEKTWFVLGGHLEKD